LQFGDDTLVGSPSRRSFPISPKLRENQALDNWKEPRNEAKTGDEMIKVTVLYNLPAGTDEEEFLRWRTTTHQQSNISQPGVLKTDFYKIVGQPMIGPSQPATSTAPYRFMTEAYWPDRDSFESAWNDPEQQAELVPAVAKITDALFLVSEEVLSHSNV
jgi:hypothetical protein